MKAMSHIRQSAGDRAFSVFVYVIVTAFFLMVAYPLYFVIIASVSDPNAVSSGKVLLYPIGINFEGYRRVFRDSLIMSGYRNTIFYTVVGTLFNLVLTLPAAYALSKKDLVGRTFLMAVFTFTMYFGGGMIPTYLIVKNVGLLNNRMAVILPTLVNTWNLIVMRTSFKAIPVSLEESARLDGANEPTILFRIIIPCAKATIAVMILYYAVEHWNSWFDAMIYLTNRRKFPLQLFLREILLIHVNNAASAAAADAGDSLYLDTLLKYALIIISTVPILCIYPFVQKYFMKGVMMGSVKE